MKASLTIAKLILIKAWRRHLFSSLVLLLIPALVAAWGFEAANPGFQTGFVKDVAGMFMSFFAALLLLVLAYDHCHWPDDKNPPWFYMSRCKSRSELTAGRFGGICLVIFMGLAVIASAFLLFMRLASGYWFFELYIIAALKFMQFMLLTAMIILFSQLMTKLLSLGAIILICIAGVSSDLIRQVLEAENLHPLVFEPIMALLPDLTLYSTSTLIFEPALLFFLLAVLVYSLFMSGFYLLLADMLFIRQDL